MEPRSLQAILCVTRLAVCLQTALPPSILRRVYNSISTIQRLMGLPSSNSITVNAGFMTTFLKKMTSPYFMLIINKIILH